MNLFEIQSYFRDMTDNSTYKPTLPILLAKAFSLYGDSLGQLYQLLLGGFGQGSFQRIRCAVTGVTFAVDLDLNLFQSYSSVHATIYALISVATV